MRNHKSSKKPITIGEIVRTCRKSNGWTVKDFIRASKIGVTSTYISHVELGRSLPSPEFIRKIAPIIDYYNLKELMDIAKRVKLKEYNDYLNKKYNQ